MTQFTLRFFGQFHVSADGAPIVDFHSDKARALLAYLALEPREHARTELATLLWPEIGDRYARTNLRNTLYRLRQTLDTATPGAGDLLLNVTRQSVHFNEANAAVDVLRFQTVLNKEQAAPSPEVEQLTEAVGLYQGELLLGFGVADAPPFEEWLLLRRELLHQQALMALYRLVTAHESAGCYEQAHTVAGRLLTLDPYREESYRQVMRLLARMGQPRQALQQLEQLRRVLHEELGVEPAAETVALAKQIAAGAFDKEPKRQAPVVGQPHEEKRRREQEDGRTGEQDALLNPLNTDKEVSHQLVIPSSGHLVIPLWGLRDVPAPAAFFGRVAERQQLAQWLFHDRCRVVAILGIGGMGKTTLAAQSVRDLANQPPGVVDGVLWRSLLNAPLLTELLPPLLQILSNQQLATAPDNVDEQLRLLMKHLRAQRILLVLDNMESILEPERAGSYRPGYEPYGQLIQQMATLEHQSQLLLTSRERPRGYDRLEKDGLPVKSLQLAGLDTDAGQQLLLQRGLRSESDEAALLIARYSGNPLALKLVADTVDEIFAGDTREFLVGETLVFEDIRTVLDQQLARLSSFEREILFGLAVERAVTPITVLRKNLLHVPAQRSLAESLRNLQRHSLLESGVDGFTLQNVVSEYLTEQLVEAISQEIATGELRLLHRHALLKAQATEYVRESQARLLLAPICQRLLEDRQPGPRMTPNLLDAPMAATKRDPLHFVSRQLRQILLDLQHQAPRLPSYAAGNVLNLLLHLGIDVTGYDFSQLCVWQAYLRGVNLPAVNFHGADLTGAEFTHVLSQIYGVAISADDQWLATAGGNGAIQLWQLAAGEAERTLKGHQGRCTCVAFSPDGTLLASTGFDGAVRLWDVQTGACRQILQGHQNGVWRLAFNYDGTLLASGGEDRLIMVWDVATGELLSTIKHHQGWVTDVVFHPTTNLLASCSNDQAICLWDLQALWQQVQTPRATEAAAAVTLRNTLHGHTHKVAALAFSPDGACLASGSADQTIRLWEVTTGRCINTLRGHVHWVRALAFTPNGALLASGSADQTVRLWEVATGRCIDTLRGHTHTIWAVAFNAAGRLLVSGGQDHAIRLWDLENLAQSHISITLQGDISTVNAAVLSPSGDLLATADSKGGVRLWQMEHTAVHGHCIRHFVGHSQFLWALAFSPDGNYLASAGKDQVVRLWDVANGRCVEQLHGHPRAVHCVKFDPTGRLLASAGDDGTIYLWQVRPSGQGQLLTTLSGHTQVVEDLAFSPDGAWLVSCGGGQSVRIWDLRSLQTISSPAVADPVQAIHTFESGATDTWSVVFYSNGQRLASAGTDGAVRLWQLQPDMPPQLVNVLHGHRVSIRALAINPAGTMLASGGEDNNICLWDMATGQQLHVLAGHTQSVLALAFGVDGETLISGSNDGTVRVWEVERGACRQVLPMPGPYAGMNITHVTGISAAQRATLKALGAVEMLS
ncbi:MAG: BTAD domain-containing putative transcriptional regulator [Caldilineaceae bacterium]